MKSVLLFTLLTFQVGAAVSPEFAGRREKLRQSIPNGVLVLFGNKESEDLHDSFFQEPSFYYLPGWEEPGAILIITPAPEKDDPAAAERERVPREILFLPQRVLSEEKWTGRKLGPNDGSVKETTGFASVLPAEEFESELAKLLTVYPALYAVTSDPASAALSKLAPMRTVTDSKMAITRLRMEKSPAEITAIQKATDASIDAHRAAWKTIAPGKYEYQIAAVMLGRIWPRGAAGVLMRRS